MARAPRVDWKKKQLLLQITGPFQGPRPHSFPSKPETLNSHLLTPSVSEVTSRLVLSPHPPKK